MLSWAGHLLSRVTTFGRGTCIWYRRTRKVEGKLVTIDDDFDHIEIVEVVEIEDWSF